MKNIEAYDRMTGYLTRQEQLLERRNFDKMEKRLKQEYDRSCKEKDKEIECLKKKNNALEKDNTYLYHKLIEKSQRTAEEKQKIAE